MSIFKRVMVIAFCLQIHTSFADSNQQMNKMILDEYLSTHDTESLTKLWKTRFDLEYDEELAKFWVSRTFGNKWVIKYVDKRKPLQIMKAYHISSIVDPIETKSLDSSGARYILSDPEVMEESCTPTTVTTDSGELVKSEICIRTMTNEELEKNHDLIERARENFDSSEKEANNIQGETTWTEEDFEITISSCPKYRWTMSRKEACRSNPLVGTIYDAETRQAIGSINFVIDQQISTKHTRSTFSETLTYTFLSASGNWSGALLNQWVGCSSGCQASSSTLPLGRSIFVPSTYNAYVTYPTQTTTVNYFQPVYELTLGPAPINGLRWFAPVVRCDKNIARGASSGCVFYDVEPIMGTMQHSVIPHIARNIERIQQAGPNHYGRIPDGRPLQRTRDDRIRTANRNRSCPPPHGRPSPNSQWNCDEYPFASTLQGASRTTYPDWGSEWVLKSQNDRQGGFINGFYWQSRVLDGEEFWVHVN